MHPHTGIETKISALKVQIRANYIASPLTWEADQTPSLSSLRASKLHTWKFPERIKITTHDR